MLTTLSSKGQVVIPKQVRQALGLRPADKLSVRVEGGTILLEPVRVPPEEALYGLCRGCGLLNDLEEEHRREVEADEQPLRS